MRTDPVPTATSPRPGGPGRRGRGALAGLLACGAALGAAELLARLIGGQASPLLAVGGAAGDATPEWLKGFAMVGAVEVGLVDTLNSADGITVFAPTNDAFSALPKATLDLKIIGTGEDFKVNGRSSIVCGNVQTANATVYLIDNVLMPKS